MGKGKAEEGSIYKRRADVVQDDLLVNGIESNSLFQLKTNLLTRPAETEDITVTFDNAGRIVPDIVYLPMAIGITLGRLLGLSTLLTYYIGRILNLIVFIVITSIAIRIAPYGKNLMAMIMLLPISLQQASSASYDSIINAVILLYIAFILMLYKKESVKAKDYILLTILSVFIVMCKGGVYAPICIMLAALPFGIKLNKKSKIVILAAVLSALLAVLIYAGYPIFKALLFEGTARDEGEIYTVADMMSNPSGVINMWWNTLVRRGGSLLAGLLGGRLAWLDIKANWIFLMIMGIGLVLMTNIEGEVLTVSTKERIFIFASHIIAIILIFLSMIVGFTKTDSEVIQGLQGRYFIPLLPLSLMLFKTDMINLKKEKLYKLAMLLMATEAMIILECFPQFLVK